ncbi:hypothetical protein PH562_18995 [Rhizobium sp. CNPSo 4062]|uniref:hypothetical protein n=1 Tax=Rhizobium sp. CNPSo 4062 TaxID=3021410 RepID=UPI00254D7B20|nr:hypothetical protein [Rhizobium sp. CNPSo 4062]MDK4704348.1 hypothetical protein [Rhizobium sp. CNPSo 4062]
MSHEIREVVTAINKAGGKLRPADLLKALPRRDKREVVSAVQAALDRGIIKLDSDMCLIVGHSERVHQAA